MEGRGFPRRAATESGSNPALIRPRTETSSRSFERAYTSAMTEASILARRKAAYCNRKRPLPGGQPGNRNAVRTGRYTRKARALRREICLLLCEIEWALAVTRRFRTKYRAVVRRGDKGNCAISPPGGQQRLSPISQENQCRALACDAARDLERGHERTPSSGAALPRAISEFQPPSCSLREGPWPGMALLRPSLGRTRRHRTRRWTRMPIRRAAARSIARSQAAAPMARNVGPAPYATRRTSPDRSAR